MKRALAITLLVAASAIPVQAATVVISNCDRGALSDPATWQSGQWQGLSGQWQRLYTDCSVLTDFDAFPEFSSWWTSTLGRSLSEILNLSELEVAPWPPEVPLPFPNPAALLFLVGSGFPPISVGDPSAPDVQPVGAVQVWLAPTSPLPVPEPGSLGLLGVALLVQISCASRRSRADAARRSGRAHTRALRAAQVKRPSS